MNPGPAHTDDDLLEAYVAGRLDPGAAAALEARLAGDLGLTAELAERRRQHEAIHALFDPIVSEPVPERLQPARLASRRTIANRTRAMMAAAAMLLLVIGGAAGWTARTWSVTAGDDPAVALIDGAVAAHALYVRESRHAVEVPGDQKQQLDNWLSNRIDRPFAAPDLTAQGFTLVGGRLLPPVADTQSGPAAQLMYQNAEDARVTVFITAAPAGLGYASETTRVAGLDAFYWSNDRITCTVVGHLQAAEMQQVARQIYHQLAWRS
jgi:anti-sigma factor RsiW